MTLDIMPQHDKHADPTFRANTEPLSQWATDAFEGQASKLQLSQAAWRAVISTVGTARDPWEMVAGSAGAVVATLRRIIWAAAALTTCIDLGYRVCVQWFEKHKEARAEVRQDSTRESTSS